MTNTYLAITQMNIGEALVTAGLGIVVVMVVLALLACIIMIMSRIINRVSASPAGAPEQPATAPAAAPAPAPAPKPQGTPIPATQSRGDCDLIAVDDRTAAMIMAIVADQMGEPLNTLRFRSIRPID